MKLLLDVPEKIVLNASNQRSTTRSINVKPQSEMTITRRSSQEVMENIPFTLYTSKGKR